MNQEQKQEALELLQESQRVLEAGLSRLREMQELCQNESDTRKNNEDHKKQTLMPYSSDEQVNSLGTQAESLSQYIDTVRQYDDSEAWRQTVFHMRSAIQGVSQSLEATLHDQGRTYHIVERQLNSWAGHLGYQIEDYENFRDELQREIEELSNSQDES